MTDDNGVENTHSDGTGSDNSNKHHELHQGITSGGTADEPTGGDTPIGVGGGSSGAPHNIAGDDE